MNVQGAFILMLQNCQLDLSHTDTLSRSLVHVKYFPPLYKGSTRQETTGNERLWNYCVDIIELPAGLVTHTLSFTATS